MKSSKKTKRRKKGEEIRSLADITEGDLVVHSSHGIGRFIGIKKLEFDEVVKDTFYKELDRTLYDKYESFASNPLLLNIMLLTFQKHASIPERLNDFYDEAFVTLFNVILNF